MATLFLLVQIVNIIWIEELKLAYKVTLFLLINLSGTQNVIGANIPDYEFISEHDLPLEIKETSGLFCSKSNTAFTVNDSGNTPTIYEIDALGKIIDEQTFTLKNRDWEAITADENNLFIGDIGNNRGNRKTLKIQKISKNRLEEKHTTINFNYLGNPIKENDYLNHDYDAEALVSVKEHLFLFSKSWHSETLFVYRLDKVNAEQIIKPIIEINGLPGVITGGDYDFQQKRFVLVGYKLWGFGFFYPFIAILDEHLNLIKSFELEGYDQVEGICVAQKGEVWFTQESSFFSKNKLVKIKITE